MSRTLWRASLRHLGRHPWQLGLAILGVGLGVAVMVAIDVANSSAQRAFELSSDAVIGRATHTIEGSVNGLPEELYRRLRVDFDVRPSAPLVESDVVPVAAPQRALHLLGLDPFAERPFRSYVGRNRQNGVSLTEFLTRPGGAWMVTETATELGLEPGDRFEIDVGGLDRTLELMGFLAPDDRLQREAAADLVVVDIATAQEILSLEGRLTRIDLIAPDGDERQAFLDRVRAVLPGDALLTSTAERGDTAAQMTRAFRLNLQALSLLALMCGAFLIYNTMTFAVVQRRQLLATLRALGTTRRQVLTLILAEALAVGVLGVVVGEVAGVVLARGLVRLVTQTINDLYFVLNVRQVGLDPLTLVKGAVVGIGVTLAAAATPAWEASSTAPRSALVRSELESRIHRALPAATGVGVLLGIVGALLLYLPGDRLPPAFAGLFTILMGLALITPLATMGLMAVITPLAGLSLGQLGRLATRGVSAALSRTGIAIAALMIALSVMVGVDLMVRSFRSTVTRWLEYTLPADLYISVFTTQARRFTTTGATMDPEIFDRLRSLPEVEGANALRHFTAQVDGIPVRSIAIDISPMAHGVFAFKQGDPKAIWEPFERGEVVIVSEPLAYRAALEVGDSIALATPQGARQVRIGGIYYDYSSEQGILFLHRNLYRRLWRDDRVTAISLHAAAGSDLDALKDSVRTTLGPGPRARVVTNQQLREQSLRVFDRTFLITGVLRMLAVAVAFVGVLSALMALQLERTRELGVLRACGLTPGQLWRLVTQETGLMGLTAGVIAIPVGILMAAIMIFIINRRSFGWSLEMEISAASLLQTMLVAVLAALLAGLYPAWKMARTAPAESLREE